MKLEAAQFLIEAAHNFGLEADFYQSNPVRGLTTEPIIGVVCRDPWRLMGAAIATAAQHSDNSLDPDTLWDWFKDLNERTRSKNSILH